MFNGLKNYFRNLFTFVMNLIGYERFVKVSSGEAKTIWFKTYKIRPKNFTSFLIKKSLGRKHNFSKSDLWAHNNPTNHLVFSKGNKYGPTDYVVYLHPRMIKAAVENPIIHPGTNFKSKN